MLGLPTALALTWPSPWWPLSWCSPLHLPSSTLRAFWGLWSGAVVPLPHDWGPRIPSALPSAGSSACAGQMGAPLTAAASVLASCLGLMACLGSWVRSLLRAGHRRQVWWELGPGQERSGECGPELLVAERSWADWSALDAVALAVLYPAPRDCGGLQAGPLTVLAWGATAGPRCDLAGRGWSL